MDDCQSLVDAVLPIVRGFIEKFGDFYPVGAVLRSNGKIEYQAVDEGDEHPKPAHVIDVFKRTMIVGARDGTYVATLIAYSALVAKSAADKKLDAIAFKLDHRDGYSVLFFIQYHLEHGKVIEGDTFTNQGAADIFPQVASPSPSS